MAIDIIYPGWMPYKNLGIAVDIPGFVEAHRHILGYDFDPRVAGHVSRPPPSRRCYDEIELLKDLAGSAERAYAALSFSAFLAAHPPATDGKTAWDLHQDYEQLLVATMYDELLPR